MKNIIIVALVLAEAGCKNDIANLDKGRNYTFEGTVSLGTEGGVWLKNAKIIDK